MIRHGIEESEHCFILETGDITGYYHTYISHTDISRLGPIIRTIYYLPYQTRLHDIANAILGIV